MIALWTDDELDTELARAFERHDFEMIDQIIVEQITRWNREWERKGADKISR
jgi:hypothetical protein